MDDESRRAMRTVALHVPRDEIRTVLSRLGLLPKAEGLTTNDVAELLGLSKITVLSHVRTRKFPHAVKVGRSWVIPYADVEHFKAHARRNPACPNRLPPPLTGALYARDLAEVIGLSHRGVTRAIEVGKIEATGTGNRAVISLEEAARVLSERGLSRDRLSKHQAS